MQGIKTARPGGTRCDTLAQQSVALWEPRVGARFFPPIAAFAHVCSIHLGQKPNNMLPVSVSHSLESRVLV